MTADSWAMPDFPFIVIEHPISNNDEIQLSEKAEETIRQAITILTQSSENVSPGSESAPESDDNDSDLADEEVVDALEGVELAFSKDWTDGLPIVPPTPERVTQFLKAAGLNPKDVIAEEPVRRRQFVADKVAINAVMAGCLPEYMPVIVAAIRAMCSSELNLHGSSASTGGSALFVVVNGPIREKIKMNSTHNVFANGNRANATIGRALRLMIVNILSGIPGGFDRSTLGHPGKFSFCIAEDEEDSSWKPLSTERDVPEGQSSVTVMSCESPHQIMNEWTQKPEEILDTFVAALRGNMITYSIWAGNYAIVIPKQLRDIITEAEWTKQDIRKYIYEKTIVKRDEWRGAGKSAVVTSENENKEYRALRSPDDLLVIAAGGPAGGFGAIIPPWFGNKSLAVTRSIVNQ